MAAGTILTLDGEGVYIFQIGSAITANVGSSVLLKNGADPCDVFWQVTSAATLNGATFSGNVVAQAAVTLGDMAILNGRALATTAGAVTLAGANTVLACGLDQTCVIGSHTAPSLGDAHDFALLAGSTVTVAATGTGITGHVGVSPGTSITGIPAGAVLTGGSLTHSETAESIAAQASNSALYVALVGTGGATALTAELGGTTLTPGTYSFSSSANIAAGTTLTLDGAGVYIFKVGSAITANVGSSVVLQNGADPCEVFWQVTSAATLNGVTFSGNVVAQAAITLGVGATLNGRAMARTAGAVTLAGGNTVNACGLDHISCVLEIDSQVSIGGTYDLCVDAPEGWLIVLMLSYGSASTATPYGTIDLALPIVWDSSFVMPAGGPLCFPPHLVPCNPDLVGLIGYWQFLAVDLQGSGDVCISNAACLEIIDDGLCNGVQGASEASLQDTFSVSAADGLYSSEISGILTVIDENYSNGTAP
ncbi:MAG: hypothetical protein ACI9EF_001867 [Pseudohongiellaceae bacterium]